MEGKEGIQVQIFGESYRIKGGMDREGVVKLAAYVDQKMREVAQKMPAVPSARLAILAALNIAEDKFELEQERDRQQLLLEQKASSLITLLEKGMRP